MTEVHVHRVEGYDGKIRDSVMAMMEALDAGRIERRSFVLIKPNLLTAAPPERAILTHPSLVRAACEYALTKGARVLVADSPATGGFKRVYRKGGFEAALNGLPVEAREFTASAPVDMGKPFHSVEVAEEALRADVVVNLAKLKTHSQMLLTLAVKNLFGCIVGLRKPQWHMRTGVDRDMFARLLVRICQTVSPAINIVDGVLGLEGEGPGFGGAARHVGVVMGSPDAVAVDAAVCGMLGIQAEDLLTGKAAKELGLAPRSIEIKGEEPPEIRDFRLPRITPLLFGPPQMHGFMRRHLLQRPEPDPDQCRLCGECVRYCPAEAILQKGEVLRFDYDRCIRCYCCIEVCPFGALHAREPLPGTLLKRLIGSRPPH